MKTEILANVSKFTGLKSNMIYCYKVGKNSIKVETICPIPENKTKKSDIIFTLVKFAVADYKAKESDRQLFENVGEPLLSVLKGKLNCSVMFRTDNEGKPSLIIESEVPFTQTALKIKDTHTVLSASKKNLKAAIYQHSKVVESQMLAYSKVYTVLNVIETDIETADKEQAETENKKQKQTA